MTDDDLAAIRERERKRQELEARAEGGAIGSDADQGEGADAATIDAPTEPVHVTGADHLAELVAGTDVVLVDFYADWCGPCQMLEPTVEALAAEADALVAKVDVDAHQDVAGKYRVSGVPTLVLFSGGEVAERIVGVREEAQLAGLIERHGG